MAFRSGYTNTWRSRYPVPCDADRRESTWHGGQTSAEQWYERYPSHHSGRTTGLSGGLNQESLDLVRTCVYMAGIFRNRGSDFNGRGQSGAKHF